MHAHDLAARLERTRPLGNGSGERFSGYGLVGLGFASGHVLAFRRFAASSIGPPYTAIWQRNPDGEWVFHTNVDPSRSCPRYFGPLLREAREDEVELQWRSGDEMWVRARDARLHMVLRLTTTPATRWLSAVAGLLPAAAWGGAWASRLVGSTAATALGSGPFALSGRTPTGHRFQLRPRALWRVAAAAAVLEGKDLGPAVRLTQPVQLGDFSLPAEGLLMAGTVIYEREDA